MWNQRDRVLTALFAVQLVAALIFGLVVVNTIDDGSQARLAVDGTVPTGEAGAVDDGEGGAVPGDTDGATSDGDATAGDAGSNPQSADGTSSSSSGGTGDEGTGGDDGDGGTADQDAAADQGSQDTSTGGPGTRVGITDDAVKVGVLVTQTGAINFRSSAQATKSYFDMINEQGGVNGRKIVYDIRDDGLSETKGQSHVRDMINDGVFSFVGFNAPLSERSVMPIIEENEVPLVGAFGIPASPYGYSFSAAYETYGRVGGATIGQQGGTRAGLVYLSNQSAETDRIIEESWRAGLESEGLSLADEDIHSVGVEKASFDDVVTSLRLSGVDAIGTILESTAMKRLQQSMNRAGYSPLHVSSPFGGDPEVVRDPNIGDSFEGTYVLSDAHFLGSGVDEVQRYESEVERRFGSNGQVNWAGQYGWLGAKVFVDALANAGADPTREKIIEFMNTRSEYETGMTVPLTITEEPLSHIRNNPCMRLGQVSNGKVETVNDWRCPETTMDDES